jgi:hypothetical protein
MKGTTLSSSKTLMNTSKEDMDMMMTGFIEEILGKHIFASTSPLSELQKLQMKNSMIMFAQAHRHSKKDLFIEEMHE